MKITERDVEILKFINDFGFCEMPHIEKKFNVKTPRSYKIVSRLVKTGLVIHQRVFHNRHGIFRLSQRGASYTELPRLAKIPLGIYDHQMMLIELYFKLIHQYSNALWISERRLKHEKFVTGIGKRGHIPDGMLILPDGKHIAIEVELTLKGQDRLKKIFRGYSLSIREVWYYCSPKIIPTISKLTQDISFIKVYNLQLK